MAHAQYSLLDEEIEALVKGGYYPSKKDLIHDAVKTLMNVKADLRISAAVEIYKQGNISLGRGAEISGVSTIEFKEILKNRGITREIAFDEKEIKKADKIMKDLQ